MKVRGALLCSLLILPLVLLAQQPALTIGELISIPSKVLKEDRSIAIHLPNGYEASNERYPVFYLLDGEWNFHYTSALLSTLAEAGDIPKMILVGVINNNRNRDLLPDREVSQYRTKFPDSTELLATLTDFYLLSGNAVEARITLEKRLKLNPVDETAQRLIKMLKP